MKLCDRCDRNEFAIRLDAHLLCMPCYDYLRINDYVEDWTTERTYQGLLKFRYQTDD